MSNNIKDSTSSTYSANKTNYSYKMHYGRCIGTVYDIVFNEDTDIRTMIEQTTEYHMRDVSQRFTQIHFDTQDEKDAFIYIIQHWQTVDESQIDRVKQKINMPKHAKICMTYNEEQKQIQMMEKAYVSFQFHSDDMQYHSPSVIKYKFSIETIWLL